MKKVLCILLLICVPVLAIAQRNDEDYVLETRYRNPIDTTTFCKMPTMLLFVHSKCNQGYRCATIRMQEALEKDSLGIRSQYGIRLYVIYPRYSDKDIQTFDSFSPINAKVAFYTEGKYWGTFKEGTTTPYIILYDGKGHMVTKTGGTIEEVKDLVTTQWHNLKK